VTDGKFRGKLLQNSTSPSAARTARKLREILFKVISRRVKAGRILDLGAGSGTIGIEAISRGAMLATFVERSGRMCSYIRKNLSELGVKDGHGEVAEIEVLPFLMKAARRKRAWDLVFLDLPEGDEHEQVLSYLSRGSAIKLRGLLILSHRSGVTHPQNIGKLKHWRTIDQGETILTIYERM
jgi:16S rRNA (guanine(966)-N(2))-methyltransferase RsmD